MLAPKAGVTHSGGFWINNDGERLPIVDASYGNASSAGPSALALFSARSYVYADFGFLSAFMELESVI